MNSVLSRYFLLNLHLSQWQKASYFYRLVGILRSWREGSWLLQFSEALGALLISFVLVSGPFVSTSLIGVLLLACSGYWGIITLSEEQNSGLTPIHLLVLLYWAISTVAVGFSPLPQDAFSGWIIFTLYLLFFALGASIMRSPRILNWVITIFLLVSLIVSSYGVRQEFFGVEQLATWNDPTSALAKDTRVYSYLGNPNLLAGYLLAAVALSVAAVFVWRGWLCKALALTMVIINTSCLYFTDSRGGWIGMLALIITFLLLLRFWFHNYLPRFWQLWLLPLVFGSLVGFLLAGILFVEPLRLRVLSIFAGREDSSNNFRMNVWLAALDMVRDRPLIGIGPGHEVFNKIYPLYMRPNYTALSAYSIFLETAVEIGLIGLSSFLWLIIVTFSQGIRILGYFRFTGNNQGFWLIAAMAAMVGMLAHGMVDTVWFRPQINTIWWLMMAIIASQYYRLNREEYPIY